MMTKATFLCVHVLMHAAAEVRGRKTSRKSLKNLSGYPLLWSLCPWSFLSFSARILVLSGLQELAQCLNTDTQEPSLQHLQKKPRCQDSLVAKNMDFVKNAALGSNLSAVTH